MKVIDAIWTPTCNVLVIKCECGTYFKHWARIMVARCPGCYKRELWHSADPKVKGGIWGLRSMKIELIERTK